MFEVIFSHDVDITPKEATAMMQGSTRAGGQGALEVGIEPCVLITIGFIWPCGELRVGGCGAILAKESASALRLLGVSDAVSGLKLDPEKDIDVIKKMVVLGTKSANKK